MGMSKAMMERLMVAKARMQRSGDTVFCATRYGNVMHPEVPLFLCLWSKLRKIKINSYGP